MNIHDIERLHALQRECASIEAQIVDLQGMLRQKQLEMAPLVPVHSLSNDILYAIFEAAYLHHFPRCRMHSGLLKDSPVTITHVCRRWRRLAFELPSIWSCLHITPEQSKGHVDALKAFLERSKERLLSIMFIYIGPDMAYRESGLSADESETRERNCINRWPRFWFCWQVLLPQMQRWKHLAIYSYRYRTLMALCSTLNGAFPSLEYLQILLHRSVDSLLDVTYPLNVEAPKLHDLRAHMVSPILSAAYDKLTDLTLDSFPTDWSKILNPISSTLERLVLCGVSMQFDAPHFDAPQFPYLRLPRLRYLELSGNFISWEDTPVLKSVFRSARSLQAVSFSLLQPPFELFDVTFDGLFCAPSVRSIVWHCESRHGVYTPLEPWDSFVAAFPAVEDFDLWHDDGSNYLTAITNAAMSSPNGWPNLRTFEVSVRNADDLANVVAFLRHRTEVESPIEHLTLMCPPDAHRQLSQDWAAENFPTSVEWKFGRIDCDPFNSWDDGKGRPIFAHWYDCLELTDQDV